MGWTPPKGRLNYGENELDGAKRETMEETSLEELTGYTFLNNSAQPTPIFRTSYWDSKRKSNKTSVYFLAEYVSGAQITIEAGEIADYVWISAARAKKLMNYPEMSQLIDAATAAMAAMETGPTRAPEGAFATVTTSLPPAPPPPPAAAAEAGVTASRNHFTSAEARAAPASARTMPQLPALHLVSLDLQPSWEPYVKALRGPDSSATYSFAQWDAHAGVAVLAASAHADAACDGLEVCLISNVLVHCTDEPTADVLAALLTTHGVHAILINERGVEQKMVEMLTQRGVVVVRLLSQSAGRDDRQLLVLPPGAAPLSPGLSEGGAPVPVPDTARLQDGPEAGCAQDGALTTAHPLPPPHSPQDGARDGCRAPTERSVFPNVPYEEAKHGGGGG